MKLLICTGQQSKKLMMKTGNIFFLRKRSMEVINGYGVFLVVPNGYPVPVRN
jgi:hypothetical protein